MGGMKANGKAMPRARACAVALVSGAALSLALGLALSPPSLAKKVCVAAAVNPDAFSSLSGVPNKQLNIGKSIFYNENIRTTTNGLVQVLLVDGSTFTVGPNSNLTIDKFVYDPNKKTGELVATFSKGSMRFIGGKLSKNAGGVKVNTPSGALAIRGGMFQGNTQKKIYSFLFGHSMTLQGRNGKVHRVYQSGNTIDMSRPGGLIRPTTAEDTNVFMQALSSSSSNSSAGNDNASNTGSSQSATQQTGTQADNISNAAAQAVSDATAIEVQTAIA
ncbi:MAG: FecR family protein, partial [Pseudomonadota bacterium]